MNKHTMSDLYSMQAAPLSVKIKMTSRRIRDWVNEYGQDGVYVSFSGGKDSTVLVDIVRNVCGYKKIPLVFVDVPTQYPELKEFALTFDNLVILKPKISFAQVCEKYGFPMISKEVSNCVSGARKYVKYLDSQGRFELLKKTHPKFHNLLYILKNNGVTYAEAIDWINEHGDMNIKY